MCKFQPKFYDIDVSRYLSHTSLFFSLGTDVGLRYEYLIAFNKGGESEPQDGLAHENLLL